MLIYDNLNGVYNFLKWNKYLRDFFVSSIIETLYFNLLDSFDWARNIITYICWYCEPVNSVI
jgi:hypothetical protein